MEQAIISFPSLGLEMNPPAVISLFGLDIHLYGVAIALGFLLAVLYCARRAPEFGLEPDNVYDVIIWALPIGVIGARAYYIIFNYDSAKWISPTGFSGAPVFEPGGKVEKAWRTFYAEAAQGGVLLHPNHHWYVGMSHTEQDIDETLNVCETALWKVKEEL